MSPLELNQQLDVQLVLFKCLTAHTIWTFTHTSVHYCRFVAVKQGFHCAAIHQDARASNLHGASDCGLFAIATATAICNAWTISLFDQYLMKKHLLPKWCRVTFPFTHALLLRGSLKSWRKKWWKLYRLSYTGMCNAMQIWMPKVVSLRLLACLSKAGSTNWFCSPVCYKTVWIQQPASSNMPPAATWATFLLHISSDICTFHPLRSRTENAIWQFGCGVLIVTRQECPIVLCESPFVNTEISKYGMVMLLWKHNNSLMDKQCTVKVCS